MEHHFTFAPPLEIRAEYYDLRRWQREPAAECHKHRYYSLVAQGGMGKSFIIVYWQIDDIVRSDYTRRQLVLVPQRGIGRGFDAVRLVYHGKNIQWDIIKHHYYKNMTKPKIREMRETFLLRTSEDLLLGGRDMARLACVATHQGMTKIWQGLNDTEKINAIKNLTVYVDECHHLGPTELGYLINEMIELNEKYGLGLKIRLTTATYFRNDGHPIIPEKLKDLFKRHTVDYQEFLRQCGIKDFYLDYVIHKGNPYDDLIKNLQKEPEEYHLIFLQETPIRDSLDPDLLSKIMQAARSMGYDPLDLVTENTQDRNFNDLCRNSGKYRVVIAVDLFNEGKDWPQCSRIHDLACSNSSTLQVQKVMRMFRYYKNKTRIYSYMYLDESINKLTGENVNKILNCRFNILITMMIFGELDGVIDTPKLSQRCSDNKSLMATLGDQYNNFLGDLLLTMEMEDKDPDTVDAVFTTVAKMYSVQNIETIKTIFYKIFLPKELHDLKHIKDKKIRLPNSLIFGTDENILEIIPDYHRILTSGGVVRDAFTGHVPQRVHIRDFVKIERDIALASLTDRAVKKAPDRIPVIGEWVLYNGKYCRVIDVDGDDLNMRGYRRGKEIKVTSKGEVFMMRKYRNRRVRLNLVDGVWRPNFIQGVIPDNYLRLCMNDDMISKEYTVNRKNVQFI